MASNHESNPAVFQGSGHSSSGSSHEDINTVASGDQSSTPSLSLSSLNDKNPSNSQTPSGVKNIMPGSKQQQQQQHPPSSNRLSLKNFVSRLKPKPKSVATVNNHDDGDDGDSDGKYEKGRKKNKNKSKKGSKDSDEESEKNPLEEFPSISFLQMFRFADKWDRIMIVLGAIASLMVGAAMPLLILLFGNAMDDFVKFASTIQQFHSLSPEDQSDPQLVESFNSARHDLGDSTRKTCLNFFIVGMCVWVSGFIMSACWNASSERQSERIRSLYYRSILRQNVGWFDSVPTGNLTSRISGDINMIKEGIGEKIGYILQFIATFVGSLIIAFIKAWKVAFVALAMTPAMMAAVAVMGILISKWATHGQDQYAGAGAVANEVLSSIRTVMAFNSQERELRRYDAEIRKAYFSSRKKHIITGVCVGLMMLIMFCNYSASLWFGSLRILAGEYTAGEVLSAFFGLMFGGFVLGNAAPNASTIATGRGCASRVYGIIARESPIDAVDSDSGIIAGNGDGQHAIRGHIEFRDVHFAYPTRPDVPILRGFTLTIRPGEKVALVGGSGCGKSTAVGLVERFYDPEAGEIIIDGVNVKDYNVRSLRQNIGVVTQEPVLFSTSIYQNIIWGTVDPENNPPTKDEVIAAAKAANAHNFITMLPDGYDTLVGESGALLSGGQKQRIAIARALVRNPSILLLDEATSALDTESERLVQDALDRLSQNRTTISIAHRLSTIRNADRICVIRDGVVLESGSHNELITQGGEYAAMVKAQELRQQVREKVDDVAEDDDKDAIDRLVAEEISLAKGGTIARRTSTHQTFKSGAMSIKEIGLNKLIVTTPEGTREVSFVKLTKLYWRNRDRLVMFIPGFFFAVIEGAMFPLFALVFSKLMIAFSLTDHDEFRHETRKYSLLYLVYAGAAFVALGGRIPMFGIASEKLTRRLRYLSFKAMLRQEAGYFDDERHGTGALTAQLATEAEDVNKVGSLVIPSFITALAAIAAGVAIGFASDWRLTLIVIGCLPFMVLSEYAQAKASEGTAHGVSKAHQESGKAAAETIASIKTVASLTREHTFIAIFNEANSSPHAEAMRSVYVTGISYGLSQAANLLIYALVFYAGSRFIIKDMVSTEDLFRVMFALMFSAYSLGMLAQNASNYSNGVVSATKIYNLIERQPVIDGTNDTDGQAPEKFFGNVELRDVEFAYPIRPNAKILKGVSFDAKAGQTVALVGGSGSGKSTTIALIQRLYDVLAGSTVVENIDVRDWNIRQLRDSMSIVSQEPILFGMSIEENILYGKPGATHQEIEQAAKDANIYDFIRNLPDGFATAVGQKGGQLSGGQKQRIAIARAMIRNPKLLLLDEATSALDSKSERVVQEVLDKAKQGRTTITIAHRLSTIQDSDVIIVFQRGAICEQGTHDELLQRNGVYAELVRQQSLEVTH